MPLWNRKIRQKGGKYKQQADKGSDTNRIVSEKKYDLRDQGILFLLVVVALLCGNWSFVGRDYSLSRILVFFPFFAAGAFARKSNDFLKKCLRVAFLCVCVMILFLVAKNHTMINRNWLYEATSYEISHYGVGFRALHLFVGFLVTVTVMNWIPNRKIAGLNQLGGATMQIFLLHGFLIKLLEKYGFGQALIKFTVTAAGMTGQPVNSLFLSKIIAVMILFITAVIIVNILSIKLFTDLMKPLTSFDFFWKQSKDQ